MIWIALISLIFSSCSLYRKDEGMEIEALAKEVLDSKNSDGLNIEVTKIKQSK